MPEMGRYRVLEVEQLGAKLFGHHVVVAAGTHLDFLGYLNLCVRRLWMISAAVLGVGMVLVAVPASFAKILGAFLLIVAVTLVVSALKGRATLRGAQVLAIGDSRTLQMWTYPVSGRGGATVAVLATFDEIGSTNRTPLAEVRTAWFTSGIAEKPTSLAQVFGVFEPGSQVLAINEYGGVLGKVTVPRPA